jgi:hypothetical protein
MWLRLDVLSYLHKLDLLPVMLAKFITNRVCSREGACLLTFSYGRYNVRKRRRFPGTFAFDTASRNILFLDTLTCRMSLLGSISVADLTDVFAHFVHLNAYLALSMLQASRSKSIFRLKEIPERFC